jgi:hypothetical protein
MCARVGKHVRKRREHIKACKHTYG